MTTIERSELEARVLANVPSEVAVTVEMVLGKLTETASAQMVHRAVWSLVSKGKLQLSEDFRLTKVA